MARQKEKVIVVCLASLLLAGCATMPSFKWPDAPKNEPRNVYDKTETRDIRPETVTFPGPDGKPVTAQVGYSQHHTITTHVDQTPPKRSFFQRVWAQFGLWTILIILGCIFIPGFAGLMALLLGRVRGAAGQMVVGIEDFLKSDAPEDAKKKLLETLSKAYDNGTKKFVAEVKASKRR